MIFLLTLSFIHGSGHSYANEMNKIQLNTTIGSVLSFPRENFIIDTDKCMKNEKNLRGAIFEIDESTSTIEMESLKTFFHKNSFEMLNIHISNSTQELIKVLENIDTKIKKFFIGELNKPAFILITGISTNKECQKLDISNIKFLLHK